MKLLHSDTVPLKDKLKAGFSKHGFAYAQLLNAIVVNYALIPFKPRFFLYNGEKLPYFNAAYNHTWVNERTIEIPLVLSHMKDIQPTSILEIGNVLKCYWPDFEHTVVDKYDKSPGILHYDVVKMNLRRTFDLIVSISTLEHVGYDEKLREPAKFERSLAVLRKHLKKNGRIIFTVPLNYNSEMDKVIAEKYHLYGRYFMRSSGNLWHEVTFYQAQERKYIREVSAGAIGIFILK